MSFTLESEVKNHLIEFLFNLPGIRRKQVRFLASQWSDLDSLQKNGMNKIIQIFPELASPELEKYFAARKKFSKNPSFDFLSYLDPRFPERLEHLHDPPCGFYFKGDSEMLQSIGPWIGVVGTRTATPYAMNQCAELISKMKTYEPVIVSGMALGIYGRAHQTALEMGLATVGILGSKIDDIYPKEHAALFRRMESQGLLLTEVGSHARGGAWRFPERNRVIAALSDALIVVEAPEKSGALITAKLAFELGKEIFVIPGRINHGNNLGGHRLIQEGAHLLLTAEEVFLALGFRSAKNKTVKKSVRDRSGLSPEAQNLLKCLGDQALHIDKIVELGQLPAPQVTGLLTELSLASWVSELPGKIFEIIE